MTSHSDDSVVIVERSGSVQVITINRPQARNAIDAAVCEAVGDALTEADTDPHVRAVIITGAGDQSFSAGADLKALSRGETIRHPAHEEWGLAGYVHHFIGKPTIAAVNGPALGGGAEVAFASDFIVAAESATFGLPEVKRGLMPGAGGVFRLMRQLPPRIAMELLLTGEPITATAAANWGLINQVVPDGTVLDAALRLADRITVNAPLSIQACKRVAYRIDNGVSADEEAEWNRTEREFAALRQTEDAKEGPLAFTQKRAPVWQAR